MPTEGGPMKYREPEIVIPELEKLIKTTTPRFWSERDEKILRQYYGLVPIRSLAKIVGRSPHACEKKAHVMGISRQRGRLNEVRGPRA